MATFIIRKAISADIDNILKIDNFALQNTLRSELILQSINSDKCFVANKFGFIVGYVTFDKSFFMQNFIQFLLVAPEHRKCGIAQELLVNVENNCVGKLFTSCNKSNRVAQQLFLKTGFVESGIIDNLDLNDPEIIFFKKMKDQL